MDVYRFYGIVNKRYRAASSDFFCEDDTAAAALAQKMLGKHTGCEVWQRTRFVALVLPDVPDQALFEPTTPTAVPVSDQEQRLPGSVER